jgi:hypothetical protein
MAHSKFPANFLIQVERTALPSGKMGHSGIGPADEKETWMAKPNYAFAKRQRELAKKAKKEAKRQERSARHEAQPNEAEGAAMPPPADETPK